MTYEFNVETAEQLSAESLEKVGYIQRISDVHRSTFETELTGSDFDKLYDMPSSQLFELCIGFESYAWEKRHGR